jgi:hypothetical protein
MTEKQEEYKVTQEAPLSVVTVFGAWGVGKTLFGINSPYKPVMVLDNEGSSKPHKAHYEFERRDYPTWNLMRKAVEEFPSGKYGTVVIDTGTQLCEWMGREHFYKASQVRFSSGSTKAEVQSQIVWAEAKQDLRDLIYSLYDKVQVIVITAHERQKYGGPKGLMEARVLSPIYELSDVVMQLKKQPNQQIPSGILGTETTKSRIIALPPRLSQATWPTILDYITKKPANWDKLQPEELAPEVLYPSFTLPELEDEE